MELPKYHRLKNKLYQFSRVGEVQGELYSYTVMYQPSREFQSAHLPYLLGSIKLDDGRMILARLSDVEPNELEIGMRVESVLRKLKENGDNGYILYGYKFRPVLNNV